jgi:dCMP deaminase
MHMHACRRGFYRLTIQNALLESGRERLIGGRVVLYCNTCPCLGCAKKIVQLGIKEVVYEHEYGTDSSATKLFAEANVLLRKLSRPLKFVG